MRNSKCTYIHMYVYIYTCMYMYVCTQVCIYACEHVCVYKERGKQKLKLRNIEKE